MKQKKKFNIAYLAALVPAALAGVYLALLVATSGIDYTPGGFHFIAPIGQQDVSDFSLVSLLVIAATFFIWGYAGYFSALRKARLLPVLLVAHAIPLISLLMFIIFSALNMPDMAAVFTLGFGTFLLFGNLVYQLVALNSVEVFVNIAAMIGTFVVGYSIGVAKGKKK